MSFFPSQAEVNYFKYKKVKTAKELFIVAAYQHCTWFFVVIVDVVVDIVGVVVVVRTYSEHVSLFFSFEEKSSFFSRFKNEKERTICVNEKNVEDEHISWVQNKILKQIVALGQFNTVSSQYFLF